MSPLSSDWAPFLKKIVFFSTFSEEELAGIAKKMSLLALAKNVVLFRQGDAGDAMYIVRSGRLRVIQTQNGQEKPTSYISRGESVGEMSLLTGEPRADTVVVDATSELLVLQKKDFDALLNAMPSMALHLSAILSHRLLESTTKNRTAPTQAAKIYPVMSGAPLAYRAIFSVNLAISLTEQTRRRVLLLDLSEEDSGLMAMSLGQRPVRLSEKSLRGEDLQSPEILQKLMVRHPSGLELLSLPLAFLEGKLFNAIYPFLSLLRQQYGVTLILLPPKLTPASRILLEESDTLLYVERDVLTPQDTELLMALNYMQAQDTLWRVKLTEGSGRITRGPVRYHIPWSAAPGREKLDTGQIFLGERAPDAQRMVDRLARALSGLRIGLAMGSGAAYGYTMIGMLKVLERNGIYPDVVSGTSIGALIGAFYAAGKSPAELEEIAAGITKQKIWAMADFTLPRQGLILGGGVLRFLKTILKETTFEDLVLPFACVATDIVTGEEVVLRDGKVADAVRGSLSLPFFFQPYFYKGRYLVDGGLVNPVPTSVVASMGANVIISVNLTAKPSGKKVPWFRYKRRYHNWRGPNIFEVMIKTIYTMQFEIAQSRAEIAHVVLAPDMSRYTWSEFHKSSELIKIGEEVMEESLPKVKSLLPLYTDFCRVPLHYKK